MIIGSRFQNRIISLSYPQGIITYCILILLYIFLLLHARLRGINIKEQCLHPSLEGRQHGGPSGSISAGERYTSLSFSSGI